MSPPPAGAGTFDGAAVLSWMAAHEARLSELLVEEGGAPPTPPADDPSLRAHLRLVAEALDAVAPPALARPLSGFAAGLPEWFAGTRDEVDRHMARARGAIALEQHLQYGTTPGRDPSLDAALERRMRIGAWIRLFLLGMETHLGPRADGLSDATQGWLTARGRELSRLVLAFDRHAKSALPASATPADRDRVGQHAAVRASIRQLVHALEDTLAEAVGAV